VTDEPRRATTADRDTVVEILVGAFHEDPTWAWACPDPALRAGQHRALWRLFVEGALRDDGVWLTAGGTATAVWIPPGGTELSPEQEQAVEALLDSWTGVAPARVRHAMELFEAARPHDEPHHYLTLLGKHGRTHWPAQGRSSHRPTAAVRDFARPSRAPPGRHARHHHRRNVLSLLALRFAAGPIVVDEDGGRG
jgi:hypothetical protein